MKVEDSPKCSNIIYSVANFTDDSHSKYKINNIDTEMFVSKIIKYNRRLDKVIVKLMKALKTEREQTDLKRIIKILQEKHKHNVMYLAKDSYKKLLKSEESFVEKRKLLLKPSTDLSCSMDHRYVQSENMIGYIKEIKRQNSYCTNDIYCPRSSCTNTINLHRDDGQTNLYSSMNSMTLRNLNSENFTLFPTIRVPFEKKYSKLKFSLSKEDSNPPERDRNVNRSVSLQKPLARQIERLEKVKKKSLTNTSLKVETKIDDLVKNINLLIEEIQRQKSYKIDKKTETVNEYKENSNNVVNCLRKNIVNVAQNQDVSVNTDVSIVCARSPRTESRFDLAKLRDKFRSSIIGTKSSTKMNTQVQAVKRTSSIGILATVATSDKSVDVNRPIIIRVKDTPETTMNEENSLSSDEENMTALVKGTNTDPLGVIALLTVSAETIRQLISNVPSINYYSYLPFFQNSNYLDKRELQFVCDICGGAFNNASALNDHIKSHHLGFAR